MITLFVLSVLLPNIALGQLTFTLGTERHDTTYQTVEDCLGLVTKIERQTAIVDTVDHYAYTSGAIPERLRVAINTVPEIVVTTAHKCSQQFPIDRLLASDSLNIPRTMNVIRLLIKAQRDADVIALTEGWMAKLSGQDTLKHFLQTQIVGLALEDMPTRFVLIRRLTDSINFTQFWQSKINFYGTIMDRARKIKDTATYESAVSWLAATPQLVSDSIKQSEEWKVAGGPLFHVSNALAYSQRKTILAKLRENVDSFHAFMEQMNKEMGGREVRVKQELAKPIVAEYWFPEKPAASRPTTPGKVAVVIPMKENLCNPCYYTERWKRLAQKFPEIEFTGVLRTKGHHGQAFGILKPEDEARMIDSFHRKVYGFPGTIAVHKTQFWRVDEIYDRRQIEEPWGNEDQYVLFGRFSFPRIIDQSGRFIENVNLAMDQDESLELFFEALLRHK